MTKFKKTLKKSLDALGKGVLLFAGILGVQNYFQLLEFTVEWSTIFLIFAIGFGLLYAGN